jgi:hypothetical protein
MHEACHSRHQFGSSAPSRTWRAVLEELGVQLSSSKVGGGQEVSHASCQQPFRSQSRASSKATDSSPMPSFTRWSMTSLSQRSNGREPKTDETSSG